MLVGCTARQYQYTRYVPGANVPDAHTTGECATTVPLWLRRTAALVVVAVGAYLAVVSAAFASWTAEPPGLGRAVDGAAALVVSALIGMAAAGVVIALAGGRLPRRWIAAGLLPAAWGLLNAIGLW